MRSAVVLPAPFGPRSPKQTPGGTSRSRSRTATRAPKRFVTPRARITDSPAGCIGRTSLGGTAGRGRGPCGGHLFLLGASASPLVRFLPECKRPKAARSEPQASEVQNRRPGAPRASERSGDRMKLGLALEWAGAKIAVPVARVQLAERLGFDSVWSAEAYGSDAFTPLAFLAAHTQRIRLGTAVAQLAARTPAATAMAAQTLEGLAGPGRVVLGLGVSGPQIVEGWYGQPWGRPARRVRDTVAILRKIFAREVPVRHEGAEISLPYTGPGACGLG